MNISGSCMMKTIFFFKCHLSGSCMHPQSYCNLSTVTYFTVNYCFHAVKGHQDCVLLNFEMSILIVRISGGQSVLQLVVHRADSFHSNKAGYTLQRGMCNACREMWISLPLYSNVPLHTTRSTQRVRYASSLKSIGERIFLNTFFLSNANSCKMASQML